jgi:hypothetical protein
MSLTLGGLPPEVTWFDRETSGREFVSLHLNYKRLSAGVDYPEEFPSIHWVDALMSVDEAVTLRDRLNIMLAQRDETLAEKAETDERTTAEVAEDRGDARYHESREEVSA